MMATNVSLLVSLVAGMRPENRASVYVRRQTLGFLRAWGRGHYDDASVCIRGLAVAFCITFLSDETYGLLGEMMSMLPDTLTYSSCWDILPEDLQALGSALGMGWSKAIVWQDLDWMRSYGNTGCHAGSFFQYGPQAADEFVFVSTLRIVLLYVAVHRGTEKLPGFPRSRL